VHAQEGKTTKERRSVKVGDVCLKWRVLIVGWRWNLLEDRLEQWLKVLVVWEATVGWLLQGCTACLGCRVHDWYVEDRLEVEVIDLVLQVRGETEQQIGSLTDNLGDTCVATVNLVHHQDDRKTGGKRLTENEASLWQRTLRGVHEKYNAIDHRQTTLDLAAEVSVTWGVNNVDSDAISMAGFLGGWTRVAYSGVLGEDRDALFAFQVAGVHCAFINVRTRIECTGLAEHCINKGGLTVVDVGNNCHIAQVRAH
jgi:hypothetical protein